MDCYILSCSLWYISVLSLGWVLRNSKIHFFVFIFYFVEEKAELIRTHDLDNCEEHEETLDVFSEYYRPFELTEFDSLYSHNMPTSCRYLARFFLSSLSPADTLCTLNADRANFDSVDGRAHHWWSSASFGDSLTLTLTLTQIVQPSPHFIITEPNKIALGGRRRNRCHQMMRSTINDALDRLRNRNLRRLWGPLTPGLAIVPFFLAFILPTVSIRHANRDYRVNWAMSRTDSYDICSSLPEKVKSQCLCK